jgi:hypothetical protein
MAKAKNILWIMCDQLRHDYLGCTGHPTLKTPNIDAQEFVDRGADPSWADVIARLRQDLFDWALHPNGHITTANGKIAAYADNNCKSKAAS